MKKIKHLLSLLLISLFAITFFTHCSDDEDIVSPKTEEKEAEESLISEDTLMINNFIKGNMEIYYFWNDEMPNIDQTKEEDPSEYFNDLLKEPDDRWSFITDDYEGLLNYFAGVQKSTGYSVLPMRFSSQSTQVIAFIEYIYPNTPAQAAGLKRGDMIYKIDGQQLDTENFSSLLGRTSFEITLGNIEPNGSISEIDPPVQVEALELNLNPIIKTNIIDTLGHKIGYLAYASFIHNYNEELEAVIQEFHQAGVTEMVLDLRYNGGGAVSSAQLLGSMLVPEGNAGNTFIESVYNNTVTNEIKRNPDDYPPDFFLRKFEEHESNLSLENLYIFTTSGTASASEMMIYGLDPYMNVVQIGTQTHGKYYASTTLSDEKKHNWAIQPIILRSINALDNIDYKQGLNPDYELADDFYNYAENELGHHREPFMSKTIYLITGEPSVYEGNASRVKSTRAFLQKDEQLRKKIYPNWSRMWVTTDELPSLN